MLNQLELTDVKSSWLDAAEYLFHMERKKLGSTFTTDDLHPLLPAPQHPNWYGVLMARLKGNGLIRRVNAVASRRKEANGRLISVWEAL